MTTLDEICLARSLCLSMMSLQSLLTARIIFFTAKMSVYLTSGIDNRQAQTSLSVVTLGDKLSKPSHRLPPLEFSAAKETGVNLRSCQEF